MSALASRLALAATCLAASVAGALAPAAGSAASRDCSRATARRLIQGHHLMGAGESIDRVVCADFDHDGRADLAYAIFSGGTAGDTAWGIFVRVGPGWRLAKRVPDTYGVAIRAAGRDLLVSNPYYGPHDPNCCPRYFVVTRWRYEGGRFVATRSYRSKHSVLG